MSAKWPFKPPGRWSPGGFNQGGDGNPPKHREKSRRGGFILNGRILQPPACNLPISSPRAAGRGLGRGVLSIRWWKCQDTPQPAPPPAIPSAVPSAVAPAAGAKVEAPAAGAKVEALLSALCQSKAEAKGAHLATTAMRFAHSLAPRSGERARERGSFPPMVVMPRCAQAKAEIVSNRVQSCIIVHNRAIFSSTKAFGGQISDAFPPAHRTSSFARQYLPTPRLSVSIDSSSSLSPRITGQFIRAIREFRG
jgi:hypothetical protein